MHDYQKHLADVINAFSNRETIKVSGFNYSVLKADRQLRSVTLEKKKGKSVVILNSDTLLRRWKVDESGNLMYCQNTFAYAGQEIPEKQKWIAV